MAATTILVLLITTLKIGDGQRVSGDQDLFCGSLTLVIAFSVSKSVGVSQSIRTPEILVVELMCNFGHFMQIFDKSCGHR